MNTVHEIKYQTISDKLIKMINDILDNKKFDENDFNKLDENDKIIYKMIIKKCGVANIIDVRLDRLISSELNNLKNDFDVLMGQIGAGNDSQRIKDNAKKMVNQMIDKKMISNNQGLKLLMQL